MSKKAGTKKMITQLYFITHIDNLPSIIKNGILSHDMMLKRALKSTQISDEEIVERRKEKQTPNGKSLWSYANLFFQPKNAMLYRVTYNSVDNIAVLAVKRDILNYDGVFMTDGNAASNNSKIESVSPSQLEVIANQIETIWWEAVPGKRKSMAECLVPDRVPSEYLECVYVANHDVAAKVKKIIGESLPVIPQAAMFFQPTKTVEVTEKLQVLEGDMFFSKMQTLTISVNCVGVMGKGLAARAKYLFPDVFVYYNDLCRKKRMKLGKPFLYKPDYSLPDQLADEPTTLSDADATRWFLLFPTKDHWRDRADLLGIEKGLEWIADNYRELGLKSVALPALGAGLGGLEWKQVGPLICSHMSELDIPVRVYLPAERKIPEQYLSTEFLLNMPK
jgi:hypothetical protein